MKEIPDKFESWFKGRGWQVREYQQQMVQAFANHQSTLLIAPTGGGKTLSGFLPSLVDLYENPQIGLHTLYISPLKALTNDIERNLMQPVSEMGLEISIETRTGDTPSHKRQRQRKKPPSILLTTPESLMLMLSYADAPRIFGTLKTIIIDEVHSFAHNKRGDFTTLAMARLMKLAPDHLRFGLSATVADPPALAKWLGTAKAPAHLLKSGLSAKPHIELMEPDKKMPFGGYMARYAVDEVYQRICKAKTSIVFVNTRSQAEFMFQNLWDANSEGLPIAIYHGSLNKEQRRKTEIMMADGKLRAIVATSALELGIDWGDIDLVIQIGAPKGVSRLLQRIGRSNHRLDVPSQAILVPSNRFEALECKAAMNAIKIGELDGEPLLAGSLDIIPQYILNCACSEPVDPEEIYHEILNAQPYANLEKPMFDALFQFTRNGGYALRNYDRYQRLMLTDDGLYTPSNKMVTTRHRMNIGTIVEAGLLKVKRLYKAHKGRILGTVEEYFAQRLTPGDTFLFAGEVLAFEGVEEMTLEAWPSKGKDPKIPSYSGGQMPLSTFLADGVRKLLNDRSAWVDLPQDTREWLELQESYSVIPDTEHLLVEQFPHRKFNYVMLYTFEGRKANQTLGMLITRRMERMRVKPVSFSVTDYGLSICTLEQVDEEDLNDLFSADILGDDLEEWILESPMLRRSFRHVATISGLTEQNYAGNKKTMKQVTFSTDLIYDVLRKYDGHHVLLEVTRQDSERELLDIKRLSDLLSRFEGKITFRDLDRVSPMAIPIVLDVRREAIKGSAIETMLQEKSPQERAEEMMQDVKDAIAKNRV